MSTYWGYYCIEHDMGSKCEFRNDTNVLREMHRHKHAIKEIMRDMDIDVSLKIGYPEDDDDMKFLLDHITCHICLINEYGQKYKFDKRIYEWDKLDE